MPIAKIKPQIEINEINPFHPQVAGRYLLVFNQAAGTQKQNCPG